MITQLLFYCFGRTKDLDGPNPGQVEVKFHAAYPSKTQTPELAAETERFFKATPSGQLAFTVKDEEVGNLFKSGKYYRIMIEEVQNPNG